MDVWYVPTVAARQGTADVVGYRLPIRTMLMFASGGAILQPRSFLMNTFTARLVSAEMGSPPTTENAGGYLELSPVATQSFQRE